MHYYYDAEQRAWSLYSAVANPTIAVASTGDLERHKLAALLHQLATELEEQTRLELLAKAAGLRTNAGFGPDFGQNIQVAEEN
jgi:hypothetical protein